MALIFDLANKTISYPPGSAEGLYQELAKKYDGHILATYCSHLSRYSGSLPKFEELSKELEIYGPVGKDALKYISGYIGMDTELPSIDPEAWIRVEDPRGSHAPWGSGGPGTLFLGK